MMQDSGETRKRQRVKANRFVVGTDSGWHGNGRGNPHSCRPANEPITSSTTRTLFFKHVSAFMLSCSYTCTQGTNLYVSKANSILRPVKVEKKTRNILSIRTVSQKGGEKSDFHAE